MRTSKDSSANAPSPHGPPGSFTRNVRPAWPLMTMSCHPCSLPSPVQVSHTTNKLPSPRSRNTRARAANSGLTNLHRCCLTSFVISLRSQVQPHQPTHSAERARAQSVFLASTERQTQSTSSSPRKISSRVHSSQPGPRPQPRIPPLRRAPSLRSQRLSVSPH